MRQANRSTRLKRSIVGGSEAISGLRIFRATIARFLGLAHNAAARFGDDIAAARKNRQGAASTVEDADAGERDVAGIVSNVSAGGQETPSGIQR